MNKNPLEEKYKLSHNVPVPVEVLDQELDTPNLPGLYHYHDYLELIYCVQGELELKTFSKNLTLHADEMVLINSGEPHGTTSLTPMSRHYCIKFLKELLTPFYDKDIVYYTRLTSTLSRIDSHIYIPSEAVLEVGNIKDLFAKASECYLSDSSGESLTIYASILSIVSFAVKYFNKSLSDGIDVQLVKNKLDIIQKTNMFIEENYQDVTLSQLSRECSVNYSYFSTLFKELYGQSFKAYLTKFRINKSVSLLCETNMDISTIAQTVGFSTASHYIKVFRQMKNISPGKFRKLTQAF